MTGKEVEGLVHPEPRYETQEEEAEELNKQVIF